MNGANTSTQPQPEIIVEPKQTPTQVQKSTSIIIQNPTPDPITETEPTGSISESTPDSKPESKTNPESTTTPITETKPDNPVSPSGSSSV